MIRSLGLLLAWAAGSVAAISVAWAGVAVVDRQAIDPGLPAVSDVASVDSRPGGSGGSSASGASGGSDPEALESGSGDRSVTGGPDAEHGSPPADDRETGEIAAASTSDGSTSTTTARTTVPPSSASTPSTPPTRPTTTSAAPTTTVATTTTTGSITTQAPTQTLTYNLVGGSTAVSFAPSGVTVLWATPNPGFTVSIEPESPGVKVEFRSEAHRSRVDAWWSNGPRHEIRDEPRD